jgi:hypothetical protein
MDMGPHRYSNLHAFGRNWYYSSVRMYFCLKAKVNGVNMVKMSKLILSSLFLSLLINAPGHAATLFYSGDAGAGGANPFGSPNQSSARYPTQSFDDFTVTDAAGWQVNNVYSNNFVTIPSFDPQTNPGGFSEQSMPFILKANPNFDFAAVPITADWSIRSGISSDGIGNLIASGSSLANVTATGRTAGTAREYTFSVSGLNIALDPGSYFLSVTPSSLNTGSRSMFDTYASPTNGLDAFNASGNGNSFTYNDFGPVKPELFPLTGINVSTLITVNPSDLSFGLTGDIRGIQGESTAVPEPLPAPWLIGMLPLGFGLLKGKLSALRSRVKSKVN